MEKKRGRPPGWQDNSWPDRMITLLLAIDGIQQKRYTVSVRELEEACGVSRQTIHTWLRMAEGMGYVDMHNGQPRALELLPEGRKLVRQYAALHDVKKWREMREELKKQYANQ